MTATESAQRIIDASVQIFGALGVVSGSVVERLYREIRPLRIYEGATEVQQLIIARGRYQSFSRKRAEPWNEVARPQDRTISQAGAGPFWRLRSSGHRFLSPIL